MSQKKIGINYDERKVAEYSLPELLTLSNGQKIETPKTWWEQRRPEIISLFEDNIYGKIPEKMPDMYFHLDRISETAMEGNAIRKEVTISFEMNKNVSQMNLLIYLPHTNSGSFPLFFGFNFFGNHSISHDPDISLSKQWFRNRKECGILNNQATEASRGVRASHWPVQRILERGYGLATIYYGDLDPDFDDGFQNGVHPLFYQKGQSFPLPNEWGAISAWAWGACRAMDYFVEDQAIDHRRTILMGHSRLGKTALWAGALDPRFAIVISNNSGCGGASLSRRNFGETIASITQEFPHWFCGNYKNYANKEDRLPVDQHMLLALIAPRPLYIASAEEDLWCDPLGEFLSAKHASPIYELLGAGGMKENQIPMVEHPILGKIGYHIRRGGHGVTSYDWECFLNFADYHFEINAS